jgi:hypothetical protein
MKLPGTRVILFNVAAGLVSIAAVVAVVRSLVHTPPAPSATRREPFSRWSRAARCSPPPICRPA